MKSADELRLSFIRANRGRLTLTPGQYDAWLKRVVAEDRRRRVTPPPDPDLVHLAKTLGLPVEPWQAETVARITRALDRAAITQTARVELVGSESRPTWDRWRVPVPAGRGTSSDLVIIDELG